jgi:hypothetical protein
MFDEERGRLSDDECLALLNAMFTNGPSGKDVLDELAPLGWEKSPLLRVFHPTVEQVHEERVRMHDRLKELGNLFGKRKKENAARSKPEEPPPSLEETKASFSESPVEVDRELRELVGLCLWEIFSDSHEVIDASGKLADLGSFRGSAGFLADWINRWCGMEQYGYMDFYMGPWLLRDRADFQPIYEMIFRRLEKAGADWLYHFPQLYLVKLPKPEEMPGPDKPPEWAGYSPSAALGQEEAAREEEEREEKLAEDIAEANQQAKADALDRPPPKVVNAYVAVYGHDPKGWPPVQADE